MTTNEIGRSVTEAAKGVGDIAKNIGGVAVADYTAETAQAAWTEIVRRMAEAGARPVIDRVFPFEEVVGAFGRLAEGPMGKVVVRIAG